MNADSLQINKNIVIVLKLYLFLLLNSITLLFAENLLVPLYTLSMYFLTRLSAVEIRKHSIKLLYVI